MMARTFLPPGPMTVRTWSGLTVMVVMRGGIFGQLGARRGNRLGHFPEDVDAGRRAPGQGPVA